MSLRRWLRWRTDSELDEEIASHLALDVQANIDRGLSPVKQGSVVLDGKLEISDAVGNTWLRSAAGAAEFLLATGRTPTAGRKISTRVPTPTVDVTSIWPPDCATIPSEVGSPSPVPCT